MHPQWGSIKKADRAQQHLTTLTAEIEAFVKRDRYGAFVGERNPKTGKHALRAFTSSEDVPPLRWSILIGEFAFNLRSALDHIACQLALTNSWPDSVIPDVFEKTSFPIYLYPANRARKPASERWSNSKRAVTYMSDPQKALLERFQPYHRRKPERNVPTFMRVPSGRRHPLWLLHELNNADKHRLLQVTARIARGFSVIVRSCPPTFKIKSISPRTGSPLANGTYIGAIDIDGDWKGVDMHLGLSPAGSLLGWV